MLHLLSETSPFPFLCDTLVCYRPHFVTALPRLLLTKQSRAVTLPVYFCPRCPNSSQNNDDPMLDYGAAVAIKFASSKSAIKDMTPLEYGTFLRNHPEQVLLIDNASCAPAERAKVRKRSFFANCFSTLLTKVFCAVAPASDSHIPSSKV